MPIRYRSLLLTLLLLAACAPRATATPVPVPGAETITVTQVLGTIPVDTPVSPTPEPSATLEPTLTFPTPLPPPGTLAPSATPQLSPARSSAIIQVLSPGPLSKVLSPIHMHGYIIPGARHLITVELYGEDDRLIYRKLTNVYTEFKWAYFQLDIPFDTHAAAELGRLQVSTADDKGNTVAQLGIHILLQPEGFEEINPPGNLDERCTLLTPLPGMEANGGTLTVAGQFRPFNTQPLILELVGEDGAILANQWLGIPDASGDTPLPFSADLAYSVDAPVNARLVMRQWDDRIDGNMYLLSQSIKLNP